jgi:S1-C subfamily serine protease
LFAILVLVFGEGKMHKKYIFVPLAAIVVLWPIIVFAQESIASLVKKVQPATVLIITYDQQGKETGMGSGFFVSSKGDIITNWHVIKGSSSAVIKTTTGAMYRMKVILAGDENKDLVRIAIDATGVNFPALSISQANPKAGESSRCWKPFWIRVDSF